MPKTEEGERAFIARAKQGDVEAFGELILQHEKIVYHVTLRMLRHEEDAKDISQEVFLKAFKNIGNFDERSAFSTWLYRIAVNTSIDEIRRRRGKQTDSLEQELESERGRMRKQVADGEETPEEHLLRQEKAAEIRQALDMLSPEHKAVLILRDIQGFSYEEIAEIIELPLGTVKSRISRARNQCKAELLKTGERKGEPVRQNKRKEGGFHEM